MTTIEEFNHWLLEGENTSFEFKEGKNGFDEGELMEYCAAIANENDGKFVLGVDHSRHIVGSAAFTGTLEKLQHELLQQLGIRVEIEELHHPAGRVLVFHISRHRPRTPVKYKGRYWMRVGPIKKEMDAETLRQIFNEYDDDFSASFVSGLTLDDLDERAVTVLKERRARRASRPDLGAQSTERTLRDLQLLTDDGLTFAALILLGQPEKIAALLPQAEIIYEWRGESRKISYDSRKEWKKPYLAVADEIWETINARNIRTPYQQGFDVPLEIPAFDENSCREAVNNAVTHRDYMRKGSSIFIRCSPQTLSVVSPGGFPDGVTPENVLHRSEWRNKRIAETLQHIGFVERSGQGLNLIFEESIRHGKGAPDFSGTDHYEVHLNIPAQVSDPPFVRYLEKVANERQIHFALEELLELERIRTKGKVASSAFRKRFLELGLVEQHGRTRGVKYILTSRYYSKTGKSGVHTRLAGLPRDAKKQLILHHISKYKKGTLSEFRQAFPDMKSPDISNLLQDLKRQGLIVREGARNAGHWIHVQELVINNDDLKIKNGKSGLNKPK